MPGNDGEPGQPGTDGMPGPQGVKGDAGDHPSEFWDSWKDLTDDFDDYPNWAEQGFPSGDGPVRLLFSYCLTFFLFFNFIEKYLIFIVKTYKTLVGDKVTLFHGQKIILFYLSHDSQWCFV